MFVTRSAPPEKAPSGVLIARAPRVVPPREDAPTNEVRAMPRATTLDPVARTVKSVIREGAAIRSVDPDRRAQDETPGDRSARRRERDIRPLAMRAKERRDQGVPRTRRPGHERRDRMTVDRPHRSARADHDPKGVPTPPRAIVGPAFRRATARTRVPVWSVVRAS
jgi:hypothetical protein